VVLTFLGYMSFILERLKLNTCDGVTLAGLVFLTWFE
jgi:hypothetical protein